MLTGEKVDINPKRFKVINGKAYLFYDRFFVNTLKKWDSLVDTETEAALIRKADEKWKNIAP